MSNQHSPKSNKQLSANEDRLLTVLLSDLEQCREEDHDMLNRIIQVIVLAFTALAAVYSLTAGALNELASTGNQPAAGDQAAEVLDASSKALVGPSNAGVFFEMMAHVAPVLISLIVFIAAFSYVLSLGIVMSYRYHYMVDLERSIQKILGHEDYIGWIEARSAVSTLNPKHLTSRYSIFHYLGTFFAVIALLVGCIAILILTAQTIHDVSFAVYAIVGVALPFAIFIFAGGWMATVNSRKMYNQGRKDVLNKRVAQEAEAKRDAEEKARDFDSTDDKSATVFDLILYVLYPRPQDFLKVGFIVFGCLLGWSLSCLGSIQVHNSVLKIVFVWFTFDFLAYQSRYQWNDIRGSYREDSKNPRSKQRRRPPFPNGKAQEARVASFAVAMYRLTLLTALIVLNVFEVGFQLALGTVGLIVISVAYEMARKHKINHWLILVLVTFGYPLRIAVGIGCFSPGILATGQMIVLAVAFLLIAAIWYGMVFVGSTWALEGCDYYRAAYQKAEEDKELFDVDELEEYHKEHIRWIAEYAQAKQSFKLEKPLLRRQLKAPWNWTIIPTFLFSYGAFSLFLRGGGLSLFWTLFFACYLGLLPALALVVRALYPDKPISWIVVLFAGFIVWITIAVDACYFAANLASLLPVNLPVNALIHCVMFKPAMLCAVCFIAYEAIYFFFLNSSYEAMAKSVEKFVGAVCSIPSVFWSFYTGQPRKKTAKDRAKPKRDSTH